MRNPDQPYFNFNPTLHSHFSNFWNRAGQLTLLFVSLGVTNAAEAGDHHRRHQRFAQIEAATCEAPLKRAINPKRALNTRHLQADQLIDGNDNPIRQTMLSIPIRARHKVELCKDYGLGLDVKVKDPAADENIYLPVEVESFSVSGKKLNIVFNGPISEKSILEIGEGVLLVDGKLNKAGELTLKNRHIKLIDTDRYPEKWHAFIERINERRQQYNDRFSSLLSSDEATPWFKALAPIDSNKSQFLSYGVSNSVQADLQPTDINVVFDNLKAHFEKKIEAGLLTKERAEEVLAMFDNPKVQEVFTDANGELNTHLMASTLATAGTVLDGAMEVFLGNNDTGMPAKVFYSTEFSDPEGDADAEVKIIDGKMNVLINHLLEYVPFQIVATGMGHEALHQDNLISQNEEIIASAAQYVTYAQQVLVNPELATKNVISSLVNNTWLLTLINSGKAGFPNPGVEKAPTLQSELALGDQALPDGSSSPFTSFKDGRIQAFYSNTPLGNSPGNNFLRQVASKIAGGQEFSRIDFDSQGLKVFDNVRALTPKQWNQVGETLKLSFDPNVLDLLMQ